MAYDMQDVFELLGFLVEQNAQLQIIMTQGFGKGGTPLGPLTNTAFILQHDKAGDPVVKYTAQEQHRDINYSHHHRCSKGIVLLRFLTEARNRHDLETSPTVPEPPKGGNQ